MNDLISRQAAISAICNACGKIDCDKMDKCEKLQLPPANCSEFPNNSDTISRQAAIDALDKRFDSIPMEQTTEILLLRKDLRDLPPVQPERLTDDDFETIRIHLNAYKEELCNQRRWKEAGEYQRIIERFMAFASAQPETAKRIVVKSKDGMTLWYQCDMCNEPVDAQDNFCRGCGRRLTDG